jgi:hypothetical protein
MAATRESHSAEAFGVSWTTNEIERKRHYIVRSHCYLTDEAFDVDWTTKKIEAKPHQIGQSQLIEAARSDHNLDLLSKTRPELSKNSRLLDRILP